MEVVAERAVQGGAQRGTGVDLTTSFPFGEVSVSIDRRSANGAPTAQRLSFQATTVEHSA